MTTATPPRWGPGGPRLVLAGLGHAHLFVLEAAVRGALGRHELVVCTGEPRHMYSGMVPGWLAGRYEADALALDVAAIVRRAGGTWHSAHVTGLDPQAQQLRLADGTVERYDYCSIAVGSQPSGMELPGVRAHAVALKPLQNVLAIGARLDGLVARGGGQVVVVGGGAAGTEIALACVARVAARGGRGKVQVTIVGREARLAGERGNAVARRIERTSARVGLERLTEATVHAVGADHVRVTRPDGERTLPADLTIWATGASAPAWFAESGLPTDARGFLRVDAGLASPADRRVFAAGDSAALDHAPEVAKAGVYAVRMGPALVQQLRHAMGGGKSPAPFRPQRRFLALLNTGDGAAIASWGALAAQGRWAMRLKDRIDLDFMARFAAIAK